MIRSAVPWRFCSGGTSAEILHRHEDTRWLEHAVSVDEDRRKPITGRTHSLARRRGNPCSACRIESRFVQTFVHNTAPNTPSGHIFSWSSREGNFM
jgi:hypothetical protein